MLARVLSSDEINGTMCHSPDCTRHACCAWVSCDVPAPEWCACADCMLSVMYLLPWTARGIFANHFQQRWSQIIAQCASQEFLFRNVPAWPLQPVTEERDVEREIREEHGDKIVDIALLATTAILDDDRGDYTTIDSVATGKDETLLLVLSTMQWKLLRGILPGIHFTKAKFIDENVKSADVWSRLWEEILPTLRSIEAFNELEYARNAYIHIHRLTTLRLRSMLYKQRPQSWREDDIYGVVGCIPFLFHFLMNTTMSRDDVRLLLFGCELNYDTIVLYNQLTLLDSDYEIEHTSAVESLLAKEWPDVYFGPTNRYNNLNYMAKFVNNWKSAFALAKVGLSADGSRYEIIGGRDLLQQERHAFDMVQQREEHRFDEAGVEAIVSESLSRQSIAGRQTSVGMGNARDEHVSLLNNCERTTFLLLDLEFNQGGNILQMAARLFPPDERQSCRSCEFCFETS